MNKFLEQIVLPYFKQYVDAKFSIALFDLKGTLLECSKITADTLNIEHEQLIGMTYKNTTPEVVRQVCHITDEQQIKQVVNIFNQISRIQEIVVKEKTIINYIDFIPYKKYFKADLVCHSPILDETGEVIATQLLSSEYYLFGLIDYLNALSNSNALSVIQNRVVKIGLSKRQHEVIFLMLCEMKQIDIAQFLNISRGTVSKTIERLCHKFEIDGISTTKLLDHARKLKLHEYIPNSLNLPRIIILNSDIQARYKDYFANKEV